MPTLKVNIEANGQPLRRAYVEHLVLGVGGTMYMTDDSGRVRSERGDVGIASFTAHADIRILCQNSVAKVLDGGTIGIPLAINQDKTVRDGDTVDLNTAAEQDDHLAGPQVERHVIEHVGPAVEAVDRLQLEQRPGRHTAALERHGYVPEAALHLRAGLPAPKLDGLVLRHDGWQARDAARFYVLPRDAP